ncbi:MAG: ComEC/Rec2 family competence protein, partial [Planctomycetota bacterium]
LSGFHVGLLGLLVVLPLARAGCAVASALLALAGSRLRPDPALPTALLALSFVPLSGAGAPAARAAIALSLAVVAPRLGRRPSGANLLGVALAVEVALDPLAPTNAGVQLSYLATLALVLVAPMAARRAMARSIRGGRIERTDRSGRPRPALARAALERALALVVCGVATSVVASLATLPIVWTRFGEWSPVGLLATPLATPALVVLVGCGWAWITCPSLVGVGPLAWTTRLLHDGLGLADHAPWSPLPLPDRPVLAVAAAALLALVGARHASPRAARRFLRGSAAAFAALLLPWPAEAGVRPDTLEVRVLDVGSGTAVLIRAPGAPTWLFDAGSRDRVGVAVDAVGPLLRTLDVGRLRVVQSHDHVDHARDLPWIGRRWRPDLWVGRPAASTREDPWRGEALEVWTVRGGAFGRNEGSIALDVRWRARSGGPRRRVVLCSDAEEHGLAAVLAGDLDGPWLEGGPVDVLLLPHHGSRSRHLGALLDHLRPRLVVVSSAEAPAAGDELQRRGVAVWTTGVDGPLHWPTRGRAATGPDDPRESGSGPARAGQNASGRGLSDRIPEELRHPAPPPR